MVVKPCMQLIMPIMVWLFWSQKLIINVQVGSRISALAPILQTVSVVRKTLNISPIGPKAGTRAGDRLMSK